MGRRTDAFIGILIIFVTIVIGRQEFVSPDVLNCVHDDTNGSDQVELYDGAPENAFFAESRRSVNPLEFYIDCRERGKERKNDPQRLC